MDVLLALNDIEICQGFKGYKRKSSMSSFQTDIVGFSAFYSKIFKDDGYKIRDYVINKKSYHINNIIKK